MPRCNRELCAAAKDADSAGRDGQSHGRRAAVLMYFQVYIACTVL